MGEVGWEPTFFRTQETTSLNENEMNRSRRAPWDFPATIFSVVIIRILSSLC
jgi:hypothetical protein